jgi:hypothetical protein
MKRVAYLAALAIGPHGFAQPIHFHPHSLLIAAVQAKAELDACAKQAGSLFGDVVVDTKWNATASKSFGPNGSAIAACVRDALKKHYQPEPGEGPDSYTVPIGTPTQVLPPIATFMPVWRAAIAPHATQAERDAFAKLVPADYTISNRCIKTDHRYARELEEAWLRGLTVIETWEHVLDKLAGHPTRMASWDGAGLVTQSDKGLCAETFDPTAARAVFDREGTCWAGTSADILVAPRVEFPKGAYTQVATQGGRTCAVTTTGSVMCCGRTDAKLGTAPKTSLRQITLGSDFTCGLDGAGTATCWGRVTTAPKAPFTKLVAGRYRVCGIHRDGNVECWPDAPSPKGTFRDIALDWGACGIHTDGRMECWERALDSERPGRWQALAIGGEGGGATLCGLRRDQSVGCTHADHIDDGEPMMTPVPQKWTKIAVSKKFGACGIRLDGTIGCSDLQPVSIQPHGTPPPKGTFIEISADESQFCAVSTAGKIACWGDPWPAARPPTGQPPTGVHGRIVDENGVPIANATVEIEEKRPAPPTVWTSAADGTWSSSTPQRMVWAKITAPGREVIDLYGEPSAFTRAVVLRPAATITIEATCDGKPCPAMVEMGHYLHDPKLEHVAPGSYRLLVWNDHGGEHERLAIIEVEVAFAANPQVVHVALKDTGSGHAIRGSATTATTTATMTSLEGLGVELHCASETYRRAATDKLGKFEIRNVPPLPCTLEISGFEPNSGEELDSGKVKIDSFANLTVPLH